MKDNEIKNRIKAVTLAEEIDPDAEVVAFTAFVEKDVLFKTKALANYFRVYFKDYINEILINNIDAQEKKHLNEAVKIYKPPKQETRGRKGKEEKLIS